MDKDEKINDIVIVGGGICGLATALALHRKGITSVVLERSENLRARGAAIIVHPNGWRALDQLGVASNLRKTAIPIQSGQYIAISSGVRKEIPLGNGELRCLKRSDLITSLAETLPTHTLRFNSQVLSVQLDPLTSHPMLRLQDGTILKCKALIGCDGVNSVISKHIFGLNSTKYFSTSVVRGVTTYEYGHGFGNEFLVMSNDKVQMGRMPITHNMVYWFVTRKYQISRPSKSYDDHIHDESSVKLRDNLMEIKQSTVRTMNGFPKEVVQMIRNSDHTSLHLTDTINYLTPWSLLGIRTNLRRGMVTVAGDAMHAMGPFLAQGGSAALEDAVVLARCLAQKLCYYSPKSMSPPSQVIIKTRAVVEEALDEYLKERKKRVFSLCMESYLVGMMVDTTSPLLKFLASIVMALLFPDPISHTRYDCGLL